MSSRFFHPQPIRGEKCWLDSAVRRLSHVAVGKENGQELWNTPPAWWSKECKHPWKNPTSQRQKDTLQTLRDKFTCLEQHLRKEDKIPTDMEEEIIQWKENRLPILFFLTHLSYLLGQSITIRQSLNDLKVHKIQSPYVRETIKEIRKAVQEISQKTEDFTIKQLNQTDSGPQCKADSGQLLRKRALEDANMPEGCPLFSPVAKRPRETSSLSPAHSLTSLSSYGVSTDESLCTDTFDDTHTTNESSRTFDTFSPVQGSDSTDSQKPPQDTPLQLCHEGNSLMQTTNSELQKHDSETELPVSENALSHLEFSPDFTNVSSAEIDLWQSPSVSSNGPFEDSAELLIPQNTFSHVEFSSAFSNVPSAEVELSQSLSENSNNGPVEDSYTISHLTPQLSLLYENEQDDLLSEFDINESFLKEFVFV